MSVNYKKIGHCPKLLVPKYHPDPLNGLGDISEKVYSTELKPIVGMYVCMYVCIMYYAEQGWVRSMTGGFEAEDEAMTELGRRDQSRNQWLRF